MVTASSTPTTARALRSRRMAEHRDESLHEEQDQESEHSPDQHSLEATRVLRPDHVHEGEDHRQYDRNGLNRKIDEESEVRSHSHESEGAFEDEHEPRAESPDGAYHRAQAAVEKVVGASRPGHRRGELRDAERGGDGEKAREEAFERAGLKVEVDPSLSQGFRALGAEGRLMIDATAAALLDRDRSRLSIEVLNRLSEGGGP